MADFRDRDDALDADSVGVHGVHDGAQIGAHAVLNLKMLNSDWGILTPQPAGSWPFFAQRALPGRPRAVERSSRPEGGLEVPEG